MPSCSCKRGPDRDQAALVFFFLFGPPSVVPASQHVSPRRLSNRARRDSLQQLCQMHRPRHFELGAQPRGAVGTAPPDAVDFASSAGTRAAAGPGAPTPPRCVASGSRPREWRGGGGGRGGRGPHRPRPRWTAPWQRAADVRAAALVCLPPPPPPPRRRCPPTVTLSPPVASPPPACPPRRRPPRQRPLPPA